MTASGGPFPGVPLDGVEVAVLGPVAVRGAAGPFRRSAALELVVYLAFHRRGAVRTREWSRPSGPTGPSRCPRCTRPRRMPGARSGAIRTGVEHLPRGGRRCACATRSAPTWNASSRAGRRSTIRTPRGGIRSRAGTALRRAPPSRTGRSSRARRPRSSRSWSTRRCGAPDELARRRPGEDADGWCGGRFGSAPTTSGSTARLLRATAAQGNRVGLRSALAELLTLAGEAPAPATAPRGWRPGARPAGCLHPETAASTESCCQARLPPEGVPPGCRVSSRHGEKLLGKVGRPRRRDGRRRDVPRADAGELVRRPAS